MTSNELSGYDAGRKETDLISVQRHRIKLCGATLYSEWSL